LASNEDAATDDAGSGCHRYYVQVYAEAEVSKKERGEEAKSGRGKFTGPRDARGGRRGTLQE
jgi:hypothetical protein